MKPEPLFTPSDLADRPRKTAERPTARSTRRRFTRPSSASPSTGCRAARRRSSTRRSRRHAAPSSRRPHASAHQQRQQEAAPAASATDARSRRRRRFVALRSAASTGRSAPIVGRVKRVASRRRVVGDGRRVSAGAVRRGRDLALHRGGPELRPRRGAVRGRPPRSRCTRRRSGGTRGPASRPLGGVAKLRRPRRGRRRARAARRRRRPPRRARRSSPRVLSGQVVRARATAPGRARTLLCAGDLVAAARALPRDVLAAAAGNGQPGRAATPPLDRRRRRSAAASAVRAHRRGGRGAHSRPARRGRSGAGGRRGRRGAAEAALEPGPPAARRRSPPRAPRAICTRRETGAALAGAAVAAATAADPACATVDCGAHGSCIDGACACRLRTTAPRCTVSGLRADASPRANIAVDARRRRRRGLARSARAPCRTLRHALTSSFGTRPAPAAPTARRRRT